VNNTIRTLQSIIDRNTNEIREVEECLSGAKWNHNAIIDDWMKGEVDEQEWYDYKYEYKLFVKNYKDYIKRKANEQRVLKNLIKDEIEIANFNRNFEWEGIV
jgi:hypothetical protein